MPEKLSATDESGELDVFQLQAHLLELFPEMDVGGAPDEMKAHMEEYGKVWDAPRGHCDKARAELGLQTRAIEDTLFQAGKTLIELGPAKPALKSQHGYWAPRPKAGNPCRMRQSTVR